MSCAFMTFSFPLIYPMLNIFFLLTHNTQQSILRFSISSLCIRPSSSPTTCATPRVWGNFPAPRVIPPHTSLHTRVGAAIADAEKPQRVPMTPPPRGRRPVLTDCLAKRLFTPCWACNPGGERILTYYSD